MTRKLTEESKLPTQSSDPELKNQLKKILHILLSDNVKAQLLLPDRELPPEN